MSYDNAVLADLVCEFGFPWHELDRRARSTSTRSPNASTYAVLAAILPHSFNSKQEQRPCLRIDFSSTLASSVLESGRKYLEKVQQDRDLCENIRRAIKQSEEMTMRHTSEAGVQYGSLHQEFNSANQVFLSAGEGEFCWEEPLQVNGLSKSDRKLLREQAAKVFLERFGLVQQATGGEAPPTSASGAPDGGTEDGRNRVEFKTATVLVTFDLVDLYKDLVVKGGFTIFLEFEEGQLCFKSNVDSVKYRDFYVQICDILAVNLTSSVLVTSLQASFVMRWLEEGQRSRLLLSQIVEHSRPGERSSLQVLAPPYVPIPQSHLLADLIGRPVMPNKPLSLPIRPRSASLESHLVALDILSLRLSSLTNKISHPARIPLTSKASFSGEIVRTNDIIVNVGGEWWIEMTASEAAEYVHRRKAALLEEHARILEGHTRPPAVERLLGPQSPNSITADEPEPLSSRPVISFHRLFHNPAIAGPSRSTASETTSRPLSPPPLSRASESLDKVDTPETEQQSLVDVLDTEADPEPQSKHVEGDDTTLNEEGLPFHEIRETLDGQPLGPIPSAASGTAETSTRLEKEDDYWSEAAIARREELRRRVFGEGSDTEDDESDQGDGTAQPFNASSNATIGDEAVVNNATSQLSRSPEPAHHTSVSPAIAPKSILKPPTRKKSVSFDSSVPLPAPEPATPSAIAAQKFGFPLPLLSDDIITSADEFAPRPVPVIAAPHPSNKISKDEEKGFAGFKRGFLTAPSTPSSSVTASAAQTATIPDPPSTQSVSSISATKPSMGERHVSFTEDTAPPAPDAPEPKRKTSLFAQRLADKEIDPSAPSASNGVVTNIRSPALSRLSENKPMVAVKSSVVEKAPNAPTHYPASSSKSIDLTASEESGRRFEDDEEEDEDEDEDELSEYSSVEEDEYDLDEALHAREIALEYHRRQAYQPLNRDLNDPASDELGPEDYNYGGGVMLGLPRISEDDEVEGRGPTIINPTPDDLKRFIRVGKLENGNLVLAPGEEGFDDTDTDDDEEETGDVNEDGDISGKARKNEIRRRREEIKRQLMGLPPSQQIAEVKPKEKSNCQEEEWKASMPPTIVPDTPATPAPAKFAASTVSAVAEKAGERTNSTSSHHITPSESAPAVASASTTPEPTAPKKVSRFKAARMAGGV